MIHEGLKDAIAVRAANVLRCEHLQCGLHLTRTTLVLFNQTDDLPLFDGAIRSE